MKKGIYIIIIGLLSIIISVSYKSLNYRETISTPDSGWDYDYDGGGSDSSWDSSPSDSSNNSGRSSNNSSVSNSNNKGFLSYEIILILIGWPLGFALIFIAMSYIGTYIYVRQLEKSKYKGKEYDYIRERAFEIYKEVQYAWSGFDYDKLRKLLSDELYNNYVTLLDQLKEKNQQNVMEDIELDIIPYFKRKMIGIQNIQEFDDKIQYTIMLGVSQKDYVIDLNSKEVVRGNSNIHTHPTYNLIFEMSKDKENTCPNCGTKLDSVASQVCPSCGSTVVSDKHDLILIKKEIKK